MHKRKQWIVAAGLALCGLLLAALTLGRPRDVPETHIKLVKCKKTATSIDKTAAGMVC